MGNSCSPGCRLWCLMASFVLSFFPLDVLDGIWDLIESVSEGFLTYSIYTISLLVKFVLLNCWNVTTLKKLNTETHVRHT